MIKIAYWIVAILAVGAVAWIALAKLGADQAQAMASPASEPQLGGVRIVVQGEKPEETIDVLIAAAKEAGWIEAKVDAPDKVTFVPPPNYNPAKFGMLLEAFEKTGKRNFGLQLLGPDGRAVGPDGKPID